jgi:hypothetical protein
MPIINLKASTKLRDWLISGNAFEGAHSGETIGIDIRRVDNSGTLERFVIKGNTVNRCGWFVRKEAGPNKAWVITDNMIHNSSRAFALEGCKNSVISNNNINGVGSHTLIELKDSRYSSVKGNVTNGGGHAVHVIDSSLVIVDGLSATQYSNTGVRFESTLADGETMHGTRLVNSSLSTTFSTIKCFDIVESTPGTMRVVDVNNNIGFPTNALNGFDITGASYGNSVERNNTVYTGSTVSRS